jgi:putative Mn2+ efflux pump MntP
MLWQRNVRSSTCAVSFSLEMKSHKSRGFFYHHSLSIVAVGLLVLWIALYCCSDPATHLGSFFGNAIADWSGSVIIILGTKYLLESRSAESRPVHGRLKNPALNFLRRHSLLLFIGATGIGDVATGSIEYKTIFAVGLTLFVITFVMNMLSIRLVRKFREIYE